MAYTWEEIKFIGKDWWGKVPFKEKVRGMVPVAGSMLGVGANKALPMLALVAVKAARLAGMQGLGALGFGFWFANLQLVIGWVIGWALADIDHVFYAVTCDPKEETCQRVKREIDLRRWKGAWKILEMTASERVKMPIRNMVTLTIIGVMGLWIATSTASITAAGLVFGLGVRLTIEMWQLKRKYQDWYWLFKREFVWVEHRIISLIITGMIVYQGIGIIRM